MELRFKLDETETGNVVISFLQKDLHASVKIPTTTPVIEALPLLERAVDMLNAQHEGVNIVNEKPPVYERCKEQFGIDWDKGIVITYGANVHTKEKVLPSDLIVHESVHVRQQLEYGVEKWWDKYFTDPAFRKSQEVEAYQAQGRFLKKILTDRNKLHTVFHKIATNMVQFYGDIFTYSEAMGILKS